MTTRRRPPGPSGVRLPVDGNWRHGSAYAYDKRGCRCDDCVAAQRVARQARTAKEARPSKREAKLLVPWNIGERTVLTRTCTSCGLLLDAEWFRRRGTGVYPDALQPTCVRCSNDHKAAYNRNERRRIKQARKRRELSLQADRNGYEWTAGDDAIVARTDLSLADMARLTHRTIAAVSNRRRAIEAAPLPQAERLVPVETWRIAQPDA